MKILHTSDCHLKQTGDERWEGLEAVISKGNELEVDLLVISGDLFDKNIGGDTLRQPLRKLFEEADYEIILIAGNHDSAAFRSGELFGKNVEVIENHEIPREIGNVRIWGCPYEYMTPEQLQQKIEDMDTAPDRADLLLFHGDLLDATFSPQELGDETDAYMPCRLEFFQFSYFDYVLAGHYHSRPCTHEFSRADDKKGYFTYCGSPVAITRRETARRCVNLIELGEKPESLPLDTFYYQEIGIQLSPADNKSPVALLKEKIEDEEIGAKATCIVKVEGFYNGEKFDLSEKDLREKILEELQSLPGFSEEDFKFEAHDSRLVFEDELFSESEKRLQQKDLPEELEDKIRQMIMEAMSRVKHA